MKMKLSTPHHSKYPSPSLSVLCIYQKTEVEFVEQRHEAKISNQYAQWVTQSNVENDRVVWDHGL